MCCKFYVCICYIVRFLLQIDMGCQLLTCTPKLLACDSQLLTWAPMLLMWAPNLFMWAPSYWRRLPIYWQGLSSYWHRLPSYWQGFSSYWRGHPSYWRGFPNLKWTQRNVLGSKYGWYDIDCISSWVMGLVYTSLRASTLDYWQPRVWLHMQADFNTLTCSSQTVIDPLTTSSSQWWLSYIVTGASIICPVSPKAVG